jgi:hypothetical protein
MTRVYRSRIDGWLAVLVVLSIAVGLTTSLATLAAGVVTWPVGLALLAGVAMPCWIVLSTRYVLDDTTLRVRSGPFSWRIPLAEITGTARTTNPLSSPALSLRRLRIDYGSGRSLMISPRDEDDFLRELEARSARARDARA